jgi:hypothetical protein
MRRRHDQILNMAQSLRLMAHFSPVPSSFQRIEAEPLGSANSPVA